MILIAPSVRFSHLTGELLGGDIGGVILLREMREAHRQRRRARDVGRGEGQARRRAVETVCDP